MKQVFLVCQFLSGNNVQCGVHILLVPWRRDAVSYLAASCPIKQHHGRYSQSAARVLKTRCGGARTATKEMPMARDSISPIRFWNRATST